MFEYRFLSIECGYRIFSLIRFVYLSELTDSLEEKEDFLFP